MTQIDKAVLKISAILRKASNIKNHFAPINQIPPETLALAATFLTKQRGVINATAVCQRWRATLLCFPQVWRKAGGRLSELEAYLERSKSVPIEVDLFYPWLVTSIVPHTSRIENLTVSVEDSAGFEQIAKHLCDPIPTLHSLKLSTQIPQLFTIEPHSGLFEGLFRHIKSLHLYGILSLRAPQSFPHITELFLCTGRCPLRPVADLVETLGQLPGLVKVDLLFQTDWYTHISSPKTITLSCVEEIRLLTPDITGPSSGGAIPAIFQFLELPRATVVSVQSPFMKWSSTPVFPDASFSQHLPNYVNLPELRVEAKNGSGELTFKSASQAVLIYHTGLLDDLGWEVQLWGHLPISSIRRVTMIQSSLIYEEEEGWFGGLLGELEFLELLELRGDCGHALMRLRHEMVRGIVRIDIDALVVHGGEYAKSQAFKFDAIKDEVGLGNMTVTYIPDPDALEMFSDFESSSEDDWDDSSSGEDDESGEDDDDDDDDENDEGDDEEEDG